MTTPKFQRSIATRGNATDDATSDQPIAVPDDAAVIDEPTREPMNFGKAVGSIDYDRRSTVHRIADQLTSEMRYKPDPRIKLAYASLIAAADAMYDATKTLRQLAAIYDQKVD